MRVTVGKGSSLEKKQILILLSQELLQGFIKRAKVDSKEQLLYRIGKSKLGCGN
jgi:hypothetical protein